jgi:TonB family protein
MIAFLLLLAVPAPSIRGIISAEDYPQSALDRGETGSVFFKLVINPQGAVDTCSVQVSSGSSILDATTCTIVRKRARFEPAVGLDGKPIYGTYRGVISWGINNAMSRKAGPDIELVIDRAPMGVSMPLMVPVSYLHGANGSVTRCEPADDATLSPRALVDLACNAIRQAPGEPIRSSDGRAVDAQDSARVQFRLQK